MGGILLLENVGLRHGPGSEILSSITLGLSKGVLAVVSGGPGAGKSALADLAGLGMRPSRGLLQLFGREVATLTPRDLPGMRRRIGFVGRTLPLIEGLSIADNVGLPLRIAGIAATERTERVGELLDWLGLGVRGPARPGQLARSERGKVEIARAVVALPDLLICDAAMDGLDQLDERRIVQLFERLIDLGGAVLVLTRDETLAARLPAGQRWRLAQGRLLPEGAIRALRQA